MLKMPVLTMFLLFLGTSLTRIEAQTPGSSPLHAKLELVRGGFSKISDLYVSPAGVVYISDAKRHYVYRLDPANGVIDSLGGRGMASTQFNGPVGIHGTNDLRIVVNDAGNGRIQVFDRRFQPMGQIVYPSGNRGTEIPRGVHVARDGKVVFWDAGSDRIVGTQLNFEVDALYRPDVSVVGQVPRLIRSGNAEFLVLDATGRRVIRYQDNGRYMGFWQWDEPIVDIRSAGDGYMLLTADALISLSGAWRQMWRIGHGAGQARLVAAHGNWIYLATDTAVYRIRI